MKAISRKRLRKLRRQRINRLCDYMVSKISKEFDDYINREAQAHFDSLNPFYRNYLLQCCANS